MPTPAHLQLARDRQRAGLRLQATTIDKLLDLDRAGPLSIMVEKLMASSDRIVAIHRREAQARGGAGMSLLDEIEGARSAIVILTRAFAELPAGCVEGATILQKGIHAQLKRLGRAFDELADHTGKAKP